MLSITSETVLGVEITDQRLLLVEVRKRRDKYQLQEIVQAAIPSEVMEDGKIKQVDTLAELLRKTMKGAGIKSSKVHLVVPSQFVVIRQLQMPDLSKKQLRKMIDFELQNSIHLPFEEPFYDFIKQPRKEPTVAAGSIGANADPKRECDITLVASSRQAIDSVVQVAKKAGLKPQSVDIRALALARAYRKCSGEEGKETLMFVDIAETSTDIHIFQGDSLKFTRNVPMSLDSYRIDRERQKPLDALAILDFLQHNTDYRSFTNDLVYEVERSVNFFRYTLNNREAALEGIILTGVLPKTGVLADYLRERMPETPIYAMPFAVLGLKEHLARTEPDLYEYAIPIGLALKEVE